MRLVMESDVDGHWDYTIGDLTIARSALLLLLLLLHHVLARRDCRTAGKCRR